MDEALEKSINAVNETLFKFTETQNQIFKCQAELSLNLLKMMLAIQGNEAKYWLSYELGNEYEVKQIIELCEQAQESFEMAQIHEIGSQVDDLVKYINKKYKEF